MREAKFKFTFSLYPRSPNRIVDDDQEPSLVSTRLFWPWQCNEWCGKTQVAKAIKFIHPRHWHAVGIDVCHTCFRMRAFRHLLAAAFLLALLLVWQVRARAQGFVLSVTTSTNRVTVNTPLTYTINLTNNTAAELQNTFVTNTLPSSVQILNATNGFVSGNIVIFQIPLFFSGGFAQMVVTVQPTAVGSITNSITVVSYTPFLTTATNVVTQVTAVETDADLGVTMTGPASGVFVNDLMAYGVTVTNLGPDDAPNVILTNTLPAGVVYKSVAPTNLIPTVSNSNVIFNLGTLASGSGQRFYLAVQPTNAGDLNFTSSVGAAGVLDPDTTNNLAGTNVTISDFLSTNLVVAAVSTQIFNPQNGLMEQIIVVSNAGPSAVPAARVIVSGLTNILYNAVGTNNGNPYVVYDAVLNPGQSACLLLQYFVSTHQTFPGPQLAAFGVTLPDLSPPTNLSTNIAVIGITQLSSGAMLIAFPTVSNRTYTVIYSSDVAFTNAAAAQPSFKATANYTQWIDYGPPETTSHPTNTPMRFYRVSLNQ